MITLFLFACVWVCTAKGFRLSGPMTYAFFAFLILTAIFRIDAMYLLPVAAVYALFAIWAVFLPWPEYNPEKPRTEIKRWWNHPRELFGFRIMQALFYLVPLDALSWLGGKTLETVGPMIKKRQRTMIKNLEMTMPEYANDEFARRVWNNWGRTFVEGLKFSTYITKMSKYIEFQNKNLLYARPQFLLAMPHFGYMGLLSTAFLNSGLTIAVTYKQARNPLTNDIVLANYGEKLVPETHFLPVGNAIPMVRALRNGEILNINSDQRFRGAPYIDFMGVPARTSTGLAQLAIKFNLPVLMAHVERTHGAHHKIVFDEFLEISNTGDTDADEINGMKIVNEAMARIIRTKPDEYLWIHKRWR
ncbi:MAG: lysophospholipid acyltransferase family protein [Alphaproteobacteria bacterium]|nr:lysophospholipid acyltransferase family protein [Alphaproteobacteria bacterium]